MSKKTLTLTGVTAAVAILTTVGLNLVAPITATDETPAKSISVDEVFEGSVSDTPSDLSLSSTALPMEVAQADTGASIAADSTGSVSGFDVATPAGGTSASGKKGGSCSMAMASEDGPVVIAGAAQGSSDVGDADVAQAENEAYPEPELTPEPVSEVAAIENIPDPAPEVAAIESTPDPAPEPDTATMENFEVAEAPQVEPADDFPASAPVSGGGACSAAIAFGDAPVVVRAEGVPGDAAAPDSVAGFDSVAEPTEPPPVDTPAESASASESAMEPTPAPAETELAAPEPAPEKTELAAVDPIETEPVAAAPKPAPALKPAARPKASKPKAPPPEVKTAWWPAKTSGKLNITYAGDASFTKAIVLLFDGAFDSADSANQNVVVKTSKGEKVPGQWLVATANRQMLLFNVDPGLYTVEVGDGLTDKGGRALAATASGPVYIP